MAIKKIKIWNFKKYKQFECEFNSGINILVGDNECGKSTILDAIHLALTGTYRGRYIKDEITPYLFNNETVREYVDAIDFNRPIAPPSLKIEIYFEGSINPEFEGDNNSDKINKVEGISFSLVFSDQYKEEYEKLVKQNEIHSLPTEYYNAVWESFARDHSITTRSIPLKSIFIDSSNYRYQNGSDAYISRLIKDILEPDDVVSASQAYRKVIEQLAKERAIADINQKISNDSTIVKGNISLGADQGNRNSWETILMTQIDGIPFAYCGKGTQCVIKTELALSAKKANNAKVILIEEPESHLSHTSLNSLISAISARYGDKQIIMSTHSSFVANKLGLSNLLLLNDAKTIRLTDLLSSEFFKKLPGYDTLRLLLCKKAILVEGSSDELIVQRAYMDTHSGSLPIEDGIEVISVGTAFLRFLEIAECLNINTAVVTDTDGNIDALKKKYKKYLDKTYNGNIKICYDECIDKIEGDDFNYDTLEPKMLKANSLDLFNNIFKTNYSDIHDLQKHMKSNKTECALAIFNAKQSINYPEYIKKAICDDE